MKFLLLAVMAVSFNLGSAQAATCNPGLQQCPFFPFIQPIFCTPHPPANPTGCFGVVGRLCEVIEPCELNVMPNPDFTDANAFDSIFFRAEGFQSGESTLVQCSEDSDKQ